MVNMICKELGVKVEEEWLGNDGKYYVIKSTGMLLETDDTESVFTKAWFNVSSKWELILSGRLKPKWMPEIGEIYYSPNFNYHSTVVKYTWNSGLFDENLLSSNLVFKTEKEAMACADKILEFLKESR